jgi:glycosyltransferase involved in cell wall biosynthesis
VRIALSGGVFGGAMATYASSAPEAVLLRAFEGEGHTVIPLPASLEVPLGLDADVYYANHFGIAAYHLAAAGARPFVFTSHNPFLASDFPQVDSRLERTLQRFVLKSADAIVALATREADRLSEEFRIPRERFVEIPNGLELDRYAVGERVSSDETVELLSVGQLLPYKGHGYLLDAVAQLAPSLPALRLTIVSHQHDLRDDYERRIDELGITDRVSFAGPFATEELAARYGACDIYVQPSLAECFPVTVLEAMACGAPVIATDVGGVAQEVGDAGLIVPPADSNALAAAIHELAVSPARRGELGRAAHRRVERLYDATSIAERHLELYERLSPRRRNAPIYRRAGAKTVIAAYRRRGALSRFVPARIRKCADERSNPAAT